MYPMGWSSEKHSDMSAQDAALDIVESRWFLIDVEEKKRKVKQYTQMIIEANEETLRISRERHPSGYGK